jgi:eukaryotic-like serine/threonine-protein kinase
VMLTRSGARLLDFGLAKPIVSAAAAQSTRLDDPVTSKGAVVGTVPYMAPEQIEGREADARTDLFAFGTLLHEMLTGARAFDAPSVASLMGAILRDDPPPPSHLVPGLPPALDHVVRRCLAKDPEDRWASAHDLLIELTWIREGGSGVSSATANVQASRRRLWRERLAWILLATSLAALAAFSGWWLRGPNAAARQPSRFLLAPPPRTAWLDWGVPTVSPDGRHVAMTATEPGGQATLWVRRVDGVAFRKVEKVTEFVDARPFWSSDSRWLLFAHGTQLWRADVNGGTPQVVCELPRLDDFGGATTNADGVVLVGYANGPIHRVPLSGGTPEPIAALDADRGEFGQESPSFLPDGRHYMFVSRSARSRVMVGTLGSSQRVEVLAGVPYAAYVPPGLIVFLRDSRVMAQRFDAEHLRLEGEPLPVEPQLQPETVAVSSTGTLVYRAPLAGSVRRHGEITSGNTRLAWLDRTGRELEGITPLGGYFNPQLSPDGRTIAVEQFDNQNAGDLWTIDVRRKLGTRLTFDARRDSDAVWAPGSDRLAWTRGGDVGGELLVQRAPGADPAVLARAGRDESGPFTADWSPDGRTVAAIRLGRTGGASAIEFLPVDGGEPIRWSASGATVASPRFSPDGRWVVYQSWETGTAEVYVQPFPPSGEKIRVSPRGGLQPDWRRDGRELYYLTADRMLMAVEVRTVAARVEFGPPIPLFKAPVANPEWGRNHYQPAADGQRFLVNVLDPTRSAGSPDVVVVLDWAESMYAELSNAAPKRP